MHKCIKKISKVLALTTMVSSFTFLPGPKVMGVNQNDSRISPTRGIADDLDRMYDLLGDDVLAISPAFLRNAMAHRILQQLNALFGSNQQFTRDYTEYLRRTGKKIGILSFNDVEQNTMEKLRRITRFKLNQTGTITVEDIAMLFNCSDARAEVQTIGAFMGIKTYFETQPDEPIRKAL